MSGKVICAAFVEAHTQSTVGSLVSFLLLMLAPIDHPNPTPSPVVFLVSFLQFDFPFWLCCEIVVFFFVVCLCKRKGESNASEYFPSDFSLFVCVCVVCFLLIDHISLLEKKDSSECGHDWELC